MLAGKIVNVTPQDHHFLRRRGGQLARRPTWRPRFKLTHLYFTAPRLDETAYQSFVSGRRRFWTTCCRIRFIRSSTNPRGIHYQHNPRTPGLLPTAVDWANLSFAKAAEVYRDRFSKCRRVHLRLRRLLTVEAISAAAPNLSRQPARDRPRRHMEDLGVPPIIPDRRQTLLHGTDPKSFVLISIGRPGAMVA